MSNHKKSSIEKIDELVKHVAKLARIKLEEKELQQYHDIQDILSMVTQIDKIAINDIAPLFHPLDLQQRLRKDEVTETNERELLQKVAPNNIETGIYLVPEVFDE